MQDLAVVYVLKGKRCLHEPGKMGSDETSIKKKSSVANGTIKRINVPDLNSTVVRLRFLWYTVMPWRIINKTSRFTNVLAYVMP